MPRDGLTLAPRVAFQHGHTFACSTPFPSSIIVFHGFEITHFGSFVYNTRIGSSHATSPKRKCIFVLATCLLGFSAFFVLYPLLGWLHFSSLFANRGRRLFVARFCLSIQIWVMRYAT